MATKIRLKRQGKKFYAFYRVVVVDSRKKRDGKVIEEIGTYNPNTQPSTIQIKSDRAQYWLGVGAQPSEPVFKLLNITGDWQKYKGLEGAEGTLKTVEAGPDAEARIAAVEDQAQKLKAAKSEAAAKAKAEAEAAAAAEEAPAEEAAEEAPAELSGNERLAMLAQAVEHLIKNIVDFPDDVSVKSHENARGELLRVRVNPEDIGRVIGRGGRTANAIRTVIQALSDHKVRVDIMDVRR